MARHLGFYMRDLSAQNFNLGSRNMVLALKNALKEKDLSFKSIAVNESHLRQFVSFIKDEHKVHTLNQIEKAHVSAFAEQLSARFEAGEIGASTAQNQLAAINSALSQARQDDKCTVHGVKEGFLPSRSHVATHDKSRPNSAHIALKEQVSDRLSCQLTLQRELGLRFKESCLLNAKSTLQQAEKTGVVRIENGTKGGRSRDIPITSPAQIQALRDAAEIQEKHHSLVPANETFADYQKACYQAISHADNGFHAERHAYANDRYAQLTGAESPVRAGVKHGESHIKYLSETLKISQEAAKSLDISARMQVANELGHSRVAISNNYLG